MSSLSTRRRQTGHLSGRGAHAQVICCFKDASQYLTAVCGYERCNFFGGTVIAMNRPTHVPAVDGDIFPAHQSRKWRVRLGAKRYRPHKYDRRHPFGFKPRSLLTLSGKIQWRIGGSGKSETRIARMPCRVESIPSALPNVERTSSLSRSRHLSSNRKLVSRFQAFDSCSQKCSFGQ